MENPNTSKKKIGSIKVNWGSMFSGKTEELLRSIRRAKIAGKKVMLYKPKTDNRYSKDEVVTHYGERFKCKVVDRAQDILKSDLSSIDVIGIDEAQFFDDEILEVCKELKYRGIEVIVSGLDMWSSGEPVKIMALLAAISNDAQKFNAICVKTGKDAYISHSLVNKTDDIQVGGSESYIAVCEEVHLELLNKSSNS